MEICRTLVKEFLFGVYYVHGADTMTLWHFKDSLSFLGTPKGVGVIRRL